MMILAIDTSCDDTSAAVVKDSVVLSNVISSQVQLHKEWGGVVPTIAKRAHQDRIDAVVAKALHTAKIPLHRIDVFAVTQGPGLAIALEVGILKAKELARSQKKPLVAVNHMEGHLYSVFAKSPTEKSQLPQLPALVLLVSGGHTDLALMLEHGKIQMLGEKLDDAIGEAFDKVARLLGLGYPGGALLSQYAKQGKDTAYPLPVPLHHVKDLNFSYSGIKAAMMRLITEKTKEGKTLSKKDIADLSASFQRVAIQHILERVQRALQIYEVRSLLVGGGVSANTLLRTELRKLCRKQNIDLRFPAKKTLCMDNAAMIGVAAWYKAQRKEFVQDLDLLDRDPVLRLGQKGIV